MSERHAPELESSAPTSPRRGRPESSRATPLYTGDLVLPGMLHAKVKESPHARARIVSIDTSRAEALRGVHAVLVGHELDYKLGLYVVDKDILAKDVVRHFGEAVAAVAAETPEIASHGRRPDRRRVRGARPRSSTTMDALAKDDAPLVHPDLGSYSLRARRRSARSRAPTSPT